MTDSTGPLPKATPATENETPDLAAAPPPSRVRLAELMSDAEETAPHSQSVHFNLSDGAKYFLTVTYLTRGTEPTWVLSTEEEDPPVVFWSVTTENPEQIYNLLLKRARNAATRPTKPERQETENKLPAIATSISMSTKAEPKGFMFLNRYRVVDEVGCGGMSRVYKAYDEREAMTVAVKVLHTHLLGESPQRTGKSHKRFEQEIKATMALAHQNIVKVYGFGYTKRENLPFMVMEHIDGSSLDDRLKTEQRLRLSHFWTVFYQTCRALSHAHTRGVVHRDVKPSNIMLVKTEQNVELVKLLDFGIAKIEPSGEETPQKLTQTGDVFGSPYYMSPEQAKGERLDARSDIYSLGCVMYQCLTGKRPFEGDNAYKTIYMHVNTPAPPFKKLRPDLALPIELEKIILKCLEKEPSKRFQSAQDLSLELQKIAQKERSLNKTDEDYVIRQTGSGTFYAVHPNTGQEQTANLLSVLALLKQAGLITDKDYNRALSADGPARKEVGKYLVEQGIIDDQTLHCAVQCRSLIEKNELKPEQAIIALHYCQRSRVSLNDALTELHFR